MLCCLCNTVVSLVSFCFSLVLWKPKVTYKYKTADASNYIRLSVLASGSLRKEERDVLCIFKHRLLPLETKHWIWAFSNLDQYILYPFTMFIFKKTVWELMTKKKKKEKMICSSPYFSPGIRFWCTEYEVGILVRNFELRSSPFKPETRTAELWLD